MVLESMRMAPSFSQLIVAYFVIITTGAISAATFPALRDSILTYGKLDVPPQTSSTAAPTRPGFVATLRSLRVPKSWFAHFYVFAPLWTIYLLLDLAIFTSPTSFPRFLISAYSYVSFLTLLNTFGIMATPLTATPWTPPPQIQLVMFCYLIQVHRRWYESWYVERPSPRATMHVGHYLVGITFYAAMAPCIWIDAYDLWIRAGEQGHDEASSPSRNIRCMLGLILFIWGSWHQYKCHVILANLRPRPVPKSDARAAEKREVAKQEYKVPFGDWFEYMVTPHYTAEMVIYLGFYMMASPALFVPSTLLVALIWVVVNLGIVARETDQWYRTQFGDDYAGVVVSSTGQRIRKRRATQTRQNPSSTGGTQPCLKQACAIQSCLTNNNYQESRCRDAIEQLEKCCQALIDAGGSSPSCPTKKYKRKEHSQ
ncbi:Steroid 5 alpha-reductase 3 [Mortierella alpina]|nr:Steroid 5 alpha-reductase 3 [Mortierella alpina]